MTSGRRDRPATSPQSEEPDDEEQFDRDVVVIGGGPAGCSAAVFAARYGLDVLVFDRGNAALTQCAFLSNYPGFPAGIDVDTFTDLLHAHVEESGATLIPDMVQAVERPEDGDGFVVDTQDDRLVRTRYVVAAAWYDGSYLEPLGGEELFEVHEHHGEEHEQFDPDYPDADGRTSIGGLYVATPNGRRNAQAIVAAGQGAHVARTLLKDHRMSLGFPEGVADHYDWLRQASVFEGEWGERDRWREWFANEAGDEHDTDLERFEELREREIDRAFGTALAQEDVAERTATGLSRLLETIGPERVLSALDDEAIRTYIERSETIRPDHE